MTTGQTSLTSPAPGTSIQDRLDQLWQRGMAIPHPEKATHFLSHVNFYRLRGYWDSFEDRTVNCDRHDFRNGATFDAVIERYEFDRELRTLLLGAFNHIEVSVRTQWAHHLAGVAGGGPSAHLNPQLFSSRYYQNLADLHRAYDRHGRGTHHYHFADCPIWAIVEVMSFGQLSRWYGDTCRPVLRLVAGAYGIDERILRAVLRHLAPMRNICAHHERLWDREFITKIAVPKRLGGFKDSPRLFNRADSGRLHNPLVMGLFDLGHSGRCGMGRGLENPDESIPTHSSRSHGFPSGLAEPRRLAGVTPGVAG